MERKRGSAWGAVIGAALLALGAVFGLQRFGTAGLIWTIAGAVLLGYNLWALLRRSGKTPPREFPLPDPEEEERGRAAAKANFLTKTLNAVIVAKPTKKVRHPRPHPAAV